MYYLRSRPAADPIKFTVDVESLLKEAGSITVVNTKRKSDDDSLESPENPEGLMEEPIKKVKIDEMEP